MFINIKNTDIKVCLDKMPNGTYEVTSCDAEGHEGLLADNIKTLDELIKLLREYFPEREFTFI